MRSTKRQRRHVAGKKEFDDCSEQARTFNTAARLLGCEAFQGSQREACECTFIQSVKAKLAEGKDAVEGAIEDAKHKAEEISNDLEEARKGPADKFEL